MQDLAGWIAPIATTIAAMMTAANLGARFTGWGFVVFVIGSIAWIVVAISTSQPNLLWSNVFLALVNGVGVWRWLGRRARFESGAREASKGSERALSPDLFCLGTLEGRKVVNAAGETIAHCIDAMAECASGRIVYAVVAEGGVGGIQEHLHAVDWRDLHVKGDIVIASGTSDAIRALPEVAPDRWPVEGDRLSSVDLA